MPKRAAGLTASIVKTAKPGVRVDGAGLQLLVQRSGAAAWIFRYRFGGKRRDMGLGPARGIDAMTLADARQKAAEARAQVRGGVDPIEARKAAKTAQAAAPPAKSITFAKAASEYIDSHEAGWRNAKHRGQWRTTIDEYVVPIIGNMPVAEVTTENVLAVLTPIWVSKAETASRVRGRIELVLDYARVRGWRSGENPARWKAHLDHLLPRRSKIVAVKHHSALPWPDLPAFLADLRERDAVSVRALEFLILTAARSGEVFGATWDEVDFESRVWTIPGARMKTNREHRIPLSVPTIEILRSMLVLERGPARYVFPGREAGRPLSVTAMMAALRRTGRADLTVHGFRSCFRDWAGETTPHPREVVEHALAHRLRDKAEAAYARGDLFTKRRRLMDDWARFCEGAKGDTPQSSIG